MKMNRRNALMGLGAIATGGGALFGSGAFSQVEADRVVSVTTTGDSSANLGLAANGSIANDSAGTGSNQLGIDASSLNPDATTEYDAVFDITNDAGGERYVAIESLSLTNGTATFFATTDGVNANLTPSSGTEVSDLSSEYVAIASGSTLTVGLSFDADDAGGSTSSDTVTIEAVDEDATGAFDQVSPGSKGGTVS